MPSHEELLKKLQTTLQLAQETTLAGPLLTVFQDFSGVLTGLLIALALLPCDTCQIFILISQILFNIRFLLPTITALEPTVVINGDISPLVIITLKLIECLIRELTDLFEDLKKCCKDKKDEHKCKCHSALTTVEVGAPDKKKDDHKKDDHKKKKCGDKKH